MAMQSFKTAVIIPCYNEAENLGRTCRSLGFGISKETSPENTILVLVNNASTDTTEEECLAIQENSPLETVIICNESTRGFIPARTAGIIAIQKHTNSLPSNTNDILIIQADADTIYGPHYIEYMSSAAEKHGPCALFEGESLLPKEALGNYPSYFKSSHDTDASLEQYFFPNDYDVIVDDKTAAYFLSDYEKWGGHQREYTESGEEIHNGTSRLYIKARLQGAVRIHVDEAQVFHSIRRITENPAYMFATAGVTRSPSWKQNWNNNIYKGPNSPELFAEKINTDDAQEAIRMRKLHIISLFTLLPYIVARALGEENNLNIPPPLAPLVRALPPRSKQDLIGNSALVTRDNDCCFK